jgi:hypothetical protein
MRLSFFFKLNGWQSYLASFARGLRVSTITITAPIRSNTARDANSEPYPIDFNGIILGRPLLYTTTIIVFLVLES